MLEIDYSLWPPGTLWFQIANFLILLFVLNIILYRPIRKILNQRKVEENSYQGMIEEFQSKANQDAKTLQEKMAAVRKEGFQQREDFKKEGSKEEKMVLDEATSSTEDKMKKAKEEIEQRLSQARASLQSEVDRFSKELVERVLGRSI
jgi:F-type H+-transporting ATPase subunit b